MVRDGLEDAMLHEPMGVCAEKSAKDYGRSREDYGSARNGTVGQKIGMLGQIIGYGRARETRVWKMPDLE